MFQVVTFFWTPKRGNPQKLHRRFNQVIFLQGFKTQGIHTYQPELDTILVELALKFQCYTATTLHHQSCRFLSLLLYRITGRNPNMAKISPFWVKHGETLSSF